MIVQCRECGAWQRRARRRTARMINALIWGLAFGGGMAFIMLAMR